MSCPSGDKLRAELSAYEGELLALKDSCAQARPILDAALKELSTREPDPSRRARAMMAALLCPGRDARVDDQLKAALDKELLKPTGWGRAIKRRLASREKVASPSPP